MSISVSIKELDAKISFPYMITSICIMIPSIYPLLSLHFKTKIYFFPLGGCSSFTLRAFCIPQFFMHTCVIAIITLSYNTLVPM